MIAQGARDRRDDCIDTRNGRLHHHICRVVHVVRVVARAAFHRIGACLPIQRIVALQARQ